MLVSRVVWAFLLWAIWTSLVWSEFPCDCIGSASKVVGSSLASAINPRSNLRSPNLERGCVLSYATAKTPSIFWTLLERTTHPTLHDC